MANEKTTKEKTTKQKLTDVQDNHFLNLFSLDVNRKVILTKTEIINAFNKSYFLDELLSNLCLENKNALDTAIHKFQLEKQYSLWIHKINAILFNWAMNEKHKIVEELYLSQFPSSSSAVKRLIIDNYPTFIDASNPQAAKEYYEKLLSGSPWKDKLKVVIKNEKNKL